MAGCITQIIILIGAFSFIKVLDRNLKGGLPFSFFAVLFIIVSVCITVGVFYDISRIQGNIRRSVFPGSKSKNNIDELIDVERTFE